MVRPVYHTTSIQVGGQKSKNGNAGRRGTPATMTLPKTIRNGSKRLERMVLASLPPREVLIARVLGSMQAPIVGLVNVLQGNIRNLVYALDAVRQQKESA